MALKKFLTGILAAAVLAAGPSISALAVAGTETAGTEEGAQPAPEQEKTPEELAAEEEARKNAVYETVPESNNLPGWPEGPKVHAASAIVMDMESGAVLYAKAAEEQHFPASITRLRARRIDRATPFTESCWPRQMRCRMRWRRAWELRWEVLIRHLSTG